MARSRNIKPGFFTNDVLGELPPLARLLFAGLWTICDREGRCEDRHKKIKAEVLPYDVCDVDGLLTMLVASGFIARYAIDGVSVIQVLAWDKHQNPHVKEGKSTLPARVLPGASPVLVPVVSQPKPEQAGLIPDSGFRIPDSPTLIPDSPTSVPDGTGADAPPNAVAADPPPPPPPPAPPAPPAEPEPLCAKDVVFASGIPLLTAAGIADKSARSFLAMQCKAHGDDRVARAIEACAIAQALQPITWLIKHLSPERPHSRSPPSFRERDRQDAEAQFAVLTGRKPQAEIIEMESVHAAPRSLGRESIPEAVRDIRAVVPAPVRRC